MSGSRSPNPRRVNHRGGPFDTPQREMPQPSSPRTTRPPPSSVWGRARQRKNVQAVGARSGKRIRPGLVLPLVLRKIRGRVAIAGEEPVDTGVAEQRIHFVVIQHGLSIQECQQSRRRIGGAPSFKVGKLGRHLGRNATLRSSIVDDCWHLVRGALTPLEKCTRTPPALYWGREPLADLVHAKWTFYPAKASRPPPSCSRPA